MHIKNFYDMIRKGRVSKSTRKKKRVYDVVTTDPLEKSWKKKRPTCEERTHWRKVLSKSIN